MATIEVHFVGGGVTTLDDDASTNEAWQTVAATVAEHGALSGPTSDGTLVVIPFDNVTFIEVSDSGGGPEVH
jgi:hypothetical protein